MFHNEVTSVQITKRGLKLLGDIAEYFRRSKTGQLEWWIEQEHRRIFQDGDRIQEVTPESISPESQP